MDANSIFYTGRLSERGKRDALESGKIFHTDGEMFFHFRMEIEFTHLEKRSNINRFRNPRRSSGKRVSRVEHPDHPHR